jgi:hypothetical protein
MKRLWISVGIFVVLVTICTLGTLNTKQVSEEMIHTITSAKKAAENGNNETALSLSKKAVDDWHTSHKILCTYMPHAKLEAIDQTLAALPMLSFYGTTDQFTAECDRGIAQINYLNESEIPAIQNIF